MRILPMLIAVACAGPMATSQAMAGETDAAPTRLRVPLDDQCSLDVAFGEESQSCWSQVCLAEKPIELGCDLSAMRLVSDVSASPDRKWLAVISVGEGHPLLEVIDLDRLRSKREYQAQTTINPYPGTVHLLGWSESALLVTSDVALTDLQNTEGRAVEPGATPLPYAIALATWTIHRVESPATGQPGTED